MYTLADERVMYVPLVPMADQADRTRIGWKWYSTAVRK
jgi:hypothetical protein